MNGIDEELICAIEKGDIEEVECLLNRGANVDAKRLSTSSLGYAIDLAHTDIARLLLERGANVDGYSCFSSQSTHLDNAASLGRIEVIKLLLNRKADVSVQNRKGYTALHEAVFSPYANAKTIELLLKYGANVNAQGLDGNTPISLELRYPTLRFHPTNPNILFILLVYGTTLNEYDRNKINKKPNLQNCLTVFEEIKAMLHLGQLIETYKNRDQKENAEAISKYINHETDQNELIKECQKVTKLYGSDEQLSFIPECLLGFIKHMAQQYLQKHKKNLFKKGAFSGLLNSIIVCRTKKNIDFFYAVEGSYEFSDHDAYNIALVCEAVNLEAKCHVEQVGKKINILLTKLEEPLSHSLTTPTHSTNQQSKNTQNVQVLDNKISDKTINHKPSATKGTCFQNNKPLYGIVATLACLGAAAILHFASSRQSLQITALFLVASSIFAGLTIGLITNYCVPLNPKLQNTHTYTEVTPQVQL